MLCLKIAGSVANSVDPDETPRSAASHLGLYCLLRPVCLNTYGKYGKPQFKQTHTDLLAEAIPICNWKVYFGIKNNKLPSKYSHYLDLYCEAAFSSSNIPKTGFLEPSFTKQSVSSHNADNKKKHQSFLVETSMYTCTILFQDSHSAGLKIYVSYFFDQYNKSRVDLLAGLLEAMVEDNVLQAK